MRRDDKPLKRLNRFKYRELNYFCYQYNSWKAQIRDIEGSLGVSGVNYDGMPHAHNNESPVENVAIRLALLSSKVDIVEKAARLTDAELASALLRYSLIASARIPGTVIRLPSLTTMRTKNVYNNFCLNSFTLNALIKVLNIIRSPLLFRQELQSSRLLTLKKHLP